MTFSKILAVQMLIFDVYNANTLIKLMEDLNRLKI